jgi:hypothetical protein
MRQFVSYVVLSAVCRAIAAGIWITENEGNATCTLESEFIIFHDNNIGFLILRADVAVQLVSISL